MKRLPQLGVAGLLTLGWLAAQSPVPSNRFFLGSRLGTPGLAAEIYEYDEAGVLVATHDLATQLPAGVGVAPSRVFPCDITSQGRLLCSTGYHPAGGWFEMGAAGAVGTFYSNPGQQSGVYDGAAWAVATPGGDVVGADYGALGAGNLRSYLPTGAPAWTSPAWEAYQPCVVGSDIYLSSFLSGPITRWDLAGNFLSSFGNYTRAELRPLPNNRLLIGSTPIPGQPTDWFVHDPSTGAEYLLASLMTVDAGAAVDASGNIWFVVGSDLVGYAAGTTTPSVTIPLSTGFADHHQLVVAGTPFAFPPASYVPFGSGCPGPTGMVPSLFAPPGEQPTIGASSTLRVANLPQSVTIPVFMLGFSDTQASGPAGAYALPLELGILGWPGCYQLVSADNTVYTITNSGTADHTVTLPPYPFLAGLQFFAQVLVLYAPSGVAVSNAITATAGW